MQKWIEYDRYLRPVIDLGRCHFKGGKGGSESKTERDIPDQTAEEKQLQDYLMGNAYKSGNMGNSALDSATKLMGQTYTPNWQEAFSEYLKRQDTLADDYRTELADALSGYQSASDRYTSQMQGAKNAFDKASSSALSDYVGKESQYLGQYADSAAKHLGQYEDSAAKHLGQYEGAMDSAKAAYDAESGKRSSAWDDLLAGNLPSAYATNRQNALNADLRGTVGSAVNGLANRGVINSSVTNKAMGDISQSASDSLAKMYNTDINTYASLLGQDAGNIKQAYDVAAGNAGSLYGAQSAADSSLYGAQSAADSTLYGNQTGSARNVFGNQYQTAQGQFDNAANAYSNTMSNLANMYQTKANAAGEKFNNINGQTNDLLNGIVISQTGSYEPITNYLNYASQLAAPSSNLFNTLYSGRMGTGSTTTTQSNGNGVWSALGSIGSAAILMCFTGDTLVTTPDGYMELANVSEGDTVLSVHDGEIVPKQVVKTYGPETREIIDVYFDNGTVWHTTKGQRYFDGKHFCYVDYGREPAVVFNGHSSKVVRVQSTGKLAAVYDIKLEGFAGENVWFANDVAAEGMGE